jgi:aldose sugar dehydrogenase
MLQKLICRLLKTSILLTGLTKAVLLLMILTGITQAETFLNVATASVDEKKELIVNDSHLKSQLVYKGVQVISNMAFLGPDDILVLEKNNGTVMRIVNGTMQQEPLIDLNAVHSDGLVGIAVSSSESNPRYVFLYITESPKIYGQDIETDEEMVSVNETLGYAKECNCVYRYEFDDGKLINPTLILELPASPGPMHNGGEIIVGPDDNLYVSVGDITGHDSSESSTKAQNYKNGPDPDGRAGILTVTQNGQIVGGKGILGDEHPLDMYYAYGIRSSFGMDFDPVTGILWNTENGPWYGDEINLVEPGFNSGWMSVQGLWKPEENERGVMELNPNLVDFDGRGKYSPPEFIWNNAVGTSALQFLNSDKYGEEYENDMFVGDVNLKYIYHFDLTNDRQELSLSDSLEDKIADNKEELQSVTFAEGFNRITDLEVGPDGHLYILSHTYQEDPAQPKGTIFRIIPK